MPDGLYSILPFLHGSYLLVGLVAQGYPLAEALAIQATGKCLNPRAVRGVGHAAPIKLSSVQSEMRLLTGILIE